MAEPHAGVCGVNRQSTPTFASLRSFSHAFISQASSSPLAIRGSRHCLASTASSIRHVQPAPVPGRVPKHQPAHQALRQLRQRVAAPAPRQHPARPVGRVDEAVADVHVQPYLDQGDPPYSKE
jgi:hypothetical protein